MSRAEYRGRTRPAPGPSTGAGTLRRPRSLSEYEQQADGSTALFQRAVRLLQPSVSHSSVVHYSAVRWSVQVNLKLVNLRVNTLKWDQMSPKKRVVNQFYQRKQTLTESLNRAWPVSEISESVTSKEAKTKLSNQTYSRQKEKAGQRGSSVESACSLSSQVDLKVQQIFRLVVAGKSTGAADNIYDDFIPFKCN